MAAGRTRAAYYNSGTYQTPTWVEITRISEVKRARARNSNERMYRGAQTVKSIAGYKKNSWTFKYEIKSPALADTVADFLQSAFDSGATIDICFMNGRFTPASTRNGERAPVIVTKFDIDEADESGCSFDVELQETEAETNVANTLFECSAFQVVTA
jgi:hypothetical protein